MVISDSEDRAADSKFSKFHFLLKLVEELYAISFALFSRYWDLFYSPLSPIILPDEFKLAEFTKTQGAAFWAAWLGWTFDSLDDGFIYALVALQ